ncbi:hypothetical protein EAL2_808p01700 (plasmid) [Peptoclostridium acidaminophilum DSM 3953]|uniref:NERD domain-containing protein n=1 Tax=Peptoclostridium acidaminophilum DSM 3953 TaxID=1286171 RepID=W8T9W1_PEPAC|nr:hypothetical protein [Peptoclostridium acidaminophilum]AHM57675.1 hypothetical protein EAL2_808p01700 [Peptoclostridium acidaminophilum DSM 3953]
MLDIDHVLGMLFSENRIFVSEADFQFALAWKIKELYPDLSIRLEYIPWDFDKSMHIDIVIFKENRMVAIELKYKTKQKSMIFNGETISLKGHSAQDCGRYDFLYDIQRMESIMESNYKVENAYAIMLTNDSGYWNKSNRTGTNSPPADDEFRIHEGAVVSGRCSWKSHAGAGTRKNREKDIQLKNTYEVKWKEYLPVSECLFKYTIISI